jgi:typhasterol/6-deoxotyphasterol 2alpha-hydroxylase
VNNDNATAGSATGGGRVVRVRDHLTTANLSVIPRMVLGSKKYVDYDMAVGSPFTTPEEFRWTIKEFFFLNGVLNIGDMIPCGSVGWTRRVTSRG